MNVASIATQRPHVTSTSASVVDSGHQIGKLDPGFFFLAADPLRISAPANDATYTNEADAVAAARALASTPESPAVAVWHDDAAAFRLYTVNITRAFRNEMMDRATGHHEPWCVDGGLPFTWTGPRFGGLAPVIEDAHVAALAVGGHLVTPPNVVN